MPDDKRLTDDQLLNEYMAFAETAGDDALHDSRLWVGAEVDRIVRSEPERAWVIILEAVRRSKNDKTLAFVAADPLEDLVRLHAAQFVDRIEAACRSDRHFQRAL